MSRKSTPARQAVVTVAAWTIGFLIFFPILWIIILSFKTEGDAIKAPFEVLTSGWTLHSYFEVQERSNYALHFWNSVVLSVGSTLLALVIAVPAAWAYWPGAMDPAKVVARPPSMVAAPSAETRLGIGCWLKKSLIRTRVPSAPSRIRSGPAR